MPTVRLKDRPDFTIEVGADSALLNDPRYEVVGGAQGTTGSDPFITLYSPQNQQVSVRKSDPLYQQYINSSFKTSPYSSPGSGYVRDSSGGTITQAEYQQRQQQQQAGTTPTDLIDNPWYQAGSTQGYRTNQYLSPTPQFAGQSVADYINPQTGQSDPDGVPYYKYEAPGAGAGTTGGTGNTEYDALLKTLEDYIKQLEKNGQVLNPDIEITPEKAAEFMRQAQDEIDPYYSSQLKLAREGFLTSIGYSGNELLQYENQLEQKYGQAVRGIGESAAEVGFAQSGIRQRGERELATGVQESIDANRRQLQFDVGQGARSFAQQYGSSNLPNQNLNNAPRVLAGQGQFQDVGGQSPLFNLSDEVYQNIIGSEQYKQRGAVKSRASELEQAFRTGQNINQQRQLL